MSSRIQVVVAKHEKQVFRAAAERAGMSLSSWLKHCATHVLETSENKSPRNAEELRGFFTECDNREQGVEPDWAEQKRIIERSSTSGITNT
jgi:hypothetical protein